MIETIRQREKLHYAEAPDGVLYLSNGVFILRSAEQDINRIAELVNRNRKKDKIEPRETAFILDMLSNVKGNFELTQPPYVLESDDYVCHLYTDGTQYFQYDKRLLDMFQSSDFRLFIDDHRDYSVSGHNLLFKSKDGAVLGIVAPLHVDERLYERLVHTLPLDHPRKSVIALIRENPTGDPYIGQEFFDGRDTCIIAAIRIRDGAAFYEVPRIQNGKVSKNARLIPVAEMEQTIERWQAKQKPARQSIKAGLQTHKQTAQKQKSTPTQATPSTDAR